MRALRRSLLAAVPVALIPTSAVAAPSMTTDRPCYSEDETITFAGQGFTPGAKIVFFMGANDRLGTVETTADSAGAFSYPFRGPKLEDFNAQRPSVELFVSANDQSKINPDGTFNGPPEESFAAATFRVSEWSLDVAKWNSRTATAKRGQAFKVVTHGWTSAGDTLYVHYLRGGKAVHSHEVGALKGDCGDLTKSLRAFTFKSAKPGRYSVRFSTSARWNGKDAWLGYRSVRLVG